MAVVELRIVSNGHALEKLPPMCLYCGDPVDRGTSLRIAVGNQQYSFLIPLCDRHDRKGVADIQTENASRLANVTPNSLLGIGINLIGKAAVAAQSNSLVIRVNGADREFARALDWIRRQEAKEFERNLVAAPTAAPQAKSAEDIAAAAQFADIDDRSTAPRRRPRSSPLLLILAIGGVLLLGGLGCAGAVIAWFVFRSPSQTQQNAGGSATSNKDSTTSAPAKSKETELSLIKKLNKPLSEDLTFVHDDTDMVRIMRIADMWNNQSLNKLYLNQTTWTKTLNNALGLDPTDIERMTEVNIIGGANKPATSYYIFLTVNPYDENRIKEKLVGTKPRKLQMFGKNWFIAPKPLASNSNKTVGVYFHKPRIFFVAMDDVSRTNVIRDSPRSITTGPIAKALEMTSSDGNHLIFGTTAKAFAGGVTGNGKTVAFGSNAFEYEEWFTCDNVSNAEAQVVVANGNRTNPRTPAAQAEVLRDSKVTIKGTTVTVSGRAEMNSSTLSLEGPKLVLGFSE